MRTSGKQKISIQRDQLDRRFGRLKEKNNNVPGEGWIRTIRESLGMSSTQLARRLGITKQSLNRIEKNELTGAVTLETLRRVAMALECNVQLALIPNKSLQNILEIRALEVASKIIERTNLHMELEKQETDKSFRQKRIKELADELIRTGDHRIWEDL